MRSGFKHSSRGFSLPEMLVVVALIGVLSLISIPAFINFRNGNNFKSALRTFTQDARYARQYSITHSVDVAIDIDPPGNTLTSKNYTFYSWNSTTSNWDALTIPGGTANVKRLPANIYVVSTNQVPANGTKKRLVYHPNGAVDLTAGASSGQVVLGCVWKKVTYDRYTVTVSPTGQLTSVGSHT